MDTKFIIDGATVHVIKFTEDTIHDNLPPKIYTVEYSDLFGYSLGITKDKLELPTKIYGNTLDRVEKCITTYKNRTSSTGILLTGDKGTGKTLLMSLLANQVISNLGLPVILITNPYHGGQFTSFIESIGECCIVFDEFGKMYSSDRTDDNRVPQKSLLSLMDGVDKTKRMLVFTENKEHDINEFMLNRPSRVFYHFKYTKLDEKSITGYCSDHEITSGMITDLLELSRKSRIFSFDMLQCIVEEYLRFGTELKDIITDLNIDTRENIMPTVKIISVTDKMTNKRYDVVGSSICYISDGYFNFDINRLDDNSIERPIIPSSVDDVFDEVVEEIRGRKSRKIYVENNELKYERGNKIVYETDGLTIIVEKQIASYTNYLDLLV